MSEIDTYDLVINGYDWGPGVDKIILHCNKSFTDESIKAEDFTISVDLQVTKWISWPPKVEDATLNRNITEAYLSDDKGNKISGTGSDITLEVSVHPEDGASNPFLYASDMMNHWQQIYKYDIRNEKLDISVTQENKRIGVLADEFTIGESTTDSVTLHYGFWRPKNASEKTPLIIWLHGMGEGGTDPYIALYGNKVVNLITPKVQDCFGPTGAYVLVPQVDGFWMQVSKEKNQENWITGKSEETVSIYTEALFNLIDEFVKNHPEVDKNRIYVGGCSNGGYMTINMLLQYPDYFAAAYPICEAYPDSKIDEDKLAVLGRQSIWFTQSKDDKTVKPKSFVLPTYKRLVKAGAKDIHLTLWDSVTDQTGKFKDKKGKPYKYNGHFSWVYTLNNECKEDGISIFEWLAKHSK